MIAKYYTQVKQQSLDGGLTWVDVTPRETRTSPIAYPNDVDCGGDMDYTSVGVVFLTNSNGIGWIGRSGGTMDKENLLAYSDVMKEAYVMEGVTSLEMTSFSDCTSLTTITLPSSLTSIGTNCFSDSPLLQEVIIPENVTYIGSDSFTGSTSLKRLFLEPSTPPTLGGNIANNTIKIYVDDASLSAYKSAWSRYQNLIRPISEIYDEAKTCKYKMQRKQESYDNVNWFNLDIYSEGEFIESGSSDCVVEETYRWKDLSGYTCDDFATCDPYKAIIDYSRIVDSSRFSIGPAKITSPFETICPNGDDTFSDSDLAQYLKSGNISYNFLMDGGYQGTLTSKYHSVLTHLEVGESTRKICLSGTTREIGRSIPPTYIKDTVSFLTALTMASSVEEICSYSFSGASLLSSLTIPDSVVYIGEGAFKDNTSLSSLVLSNNLSGISDSLFYNCTSLGSVRIPDNAKSIGVSAFTNCTSLSSVTSDGMLETIGEYAFYNCTSLSSLTLNDGLKVIDDRAFASCVGLKELEIPSSVTSIGFAAFAGCSGLTDIELSSSLSGLDSWAFLNCVNLTSIEIPSSLSVIPSRCFDGCSSLSSVTLNEGLIAIDGGAFRYTPLTSITLPSTIERIGNAVFEGSNLQELRVFAETPPSISSYIGLYDGFPVYVPILSLTEYILDDLWRFYDIRPLPFEQMFGANYDDSTSYVVDYNSSSALTESITKAHTTSYSAMVECVIGDYVTSIGDDSFNGCTSLSAITCLAMIPPTLGNDVFANTNDAPILVHSGVVSTYQAAWSEYADRIFPIEGIRDGKFYAEYNNYAQYYAPCNDSLTLTANEVQRNGYNIKTPYSAMTYCEVGRCVTSIGNYAFQYATSLSSITIPDTVTTIGSYAFDHCPSLSIVSLPNSITSIGSYALSNSSGLTSIEIPSSVTNIGNDAFDNCTSLLEIEIPSGISSINSDLFRDCHSLSSVTLPDNVTSIGNGAFQMCTSLPSITLPSSLTSIGNLAFSECSGLTSVEIPSGVTTIGNYAFENCAFQNIVIPNSVTSLGYNAFAICPNLEEITISSAITSLSDGLFYDSSSLSTIIMLAETPPSRGYDVFQGIDPDFKIYVPPYSLNAYKSAWSEYADRIYPNGEISLKFYAEYTDSTSYSSYCDSSSALTTSDTRGHSSSYEIMNYFEIGDCVTSIGNYAFGDCYKLSSVTIPDSVTTLGNGCFEQCTALTSVTVSSALTSIPADCFNSCSSLLSIELPSGITSIGDTAFYCLRGSNLQSITILAPTPPTLGSQPFYGSSCPIYVPASSVSAYQSAWPAIYGDRVQAIPT